MTNEALKAIPESAVIDEVKQIIGVTGIKLQRINTGCFKVGDRFVRTADAGTLDFEGYDFEWDIPEEEDAQEAQEDEYDVNPPVVPKAKPGEIYRLGRHRLMCGSSTDPEQVKALMGRCFR